MIARGIYFHGKPTVLICDGRCDKAWGKNIRPRVRFSDDEDDWEYLADDELDVAPTNPGTYEGRDGKPTHASHRLNKWCARQCERSRIAGRNADFELPDFSQRAADKRD